jgi:hypothetical protein
MPWQGPYYYRSRKECGRVVREYVGRGPVADLAAQLDSFKRKQRETERAAWRAKRAELAAFDADIQVLSERADLAARAALLAAGYHVHQRGEWRKRREQGHSAG